MRRLDFVTLVAARPPLGARGSRVADCIGFLLVGLTPESSQPKVP